MKELQFKGFTPATFQFLHDLKKNNNKQWFDEHKPVYETELLNPLKALVATLAPAMYTVDPKFELRPHRAISRIYRDIRFSKNKDPYKTAMWLTFQIPLSREEWKDYPGYFMEVKEKEYTLGLGLFRPKRKVMDDFREAITYDPEEFQRMTQETVLDLGYTINGEEYKHYLPNSLPEYFQPWMQRKGIWVQKVKPVKKEVYSPKFADLIEEDFLALKDLYNFMKDVVD